MIQQGIETSLGAVIASPSICFLLFQVSVHLANTGENSETFSCKTNGIMPMETTFTLEKCHPPHSFGFVAEKGMIRVWGLLRQDRGDLAFQREESHFGEDRVGR